MAGMACTECAYRAGQAKLCCGKQLSNKHLKRFQKALASSKNCIYMCIHTQKRGKFPNSVKNFEKCQRFIKAQKVSHNASLVS